MLLLTTLLWTAQAPLPLPTAAAALSTAPVPPAANSDEDDSGSPARESTPARQVWTGWRGPTRDGQATGQAWPESLEREHLVEAWRVDDLGPSYSGPLVDRDRVYTTETVDETFEAVRALDRETGEEIWRQGWEGAMEVPFFASRNGSWIRSTPVLDGDRLYVAGIRDFLVCLDAESGEVLWTVDFMERFGSDLPPFGCASSPLVVDGGVVLQGASSLVMLDAATGETRWRCLESGGDVMSAGAFSSPVVAEVAGRRQIVVQTRTDLAGVTIEDGKVLWSTPVKAFRGTNVLTPLVTPSGIFTSTYGGRAQLLRVEASDEGFAVERVWDTGSQGYMSSPVLVDGHVYLFLRSNRFTCLDLESGEERWTSPPTGDDYWSVIAQGDRLLALSDTGSLRRIEASPENYRALSQREVADAETWAHVAVAGECVVVRSLDSLVAFTWK